MSEVAVSSEKSKKVVPEEHPLAFLNQARHYHKAAEVLFSERQRVGDDDPIYFNYYQALELAFKAYRRAHGRTNKYHHKLTTLYKECQELGLAIGHEFNIQNLVNLLESGKDSSRFRYFHLESSSQPDFAWLREVLDSVMQIVSDKLDEKFPSDSRSSRAVKAIITVSKPVKK